MNSFSIDIPNLEDMFKLVSRMHEEMKFINEQMKYHNDKLICVDKKIDSLQKNGLLSINEAARYLGVCRQTVYNYIKYGDITPVYTGEDGK